MRFGNDDVDDEEEEEDEEEDDEDDDDDDDDEDDPFPCARCFRDGRYTRCTDPILIFSSLDEVYQAYEWVVATLKAAHA